MDFGIENKKMPIKVIGVGGAGGNAVEHMIKARSGGRMAASLGADGVAEMAERIADGMRANEVAGVDFIVANTDAQALGMSSAEYKIQLGEKGLGAGMNPQVGCQLAEESADRIKEALLGADMVFIAAGMGGGTGTGASPVIARIAKELGILTVAVVTKPFDYERNRCKKIAEEGITELMKHVDTLIVILNEKLEEIYEDATFEEWYENADSVLDNAVCGIADIINTPGRVNVDFADIKTVLSIGGRGIMGTGEASGEDRARIAAETAVECPLLEGVNLAEAQGLIVNITASKSIKGKEIKEIMKIVGERASDEVTMADGTVFDESMGDRVRVTVVATGMDRRKSASVSPVNIVSQPAAGTGTDGGIFNTSGVFGQPAAAPQAAPAEAVPQKPASVWKSGSAARAEITSAFRSGGNTDTVFPTFLRNQAD